MGTQGIVTIWYQNKVLYKIIAGCNGMNGKQLAFKLLDSRLLSDPKKIYDMALENGFGCKDCLVVSSNNEKHVYRGIEELSKDSGFGYYKTFDDPYWNPRWKQGSVGHLYIVVPEANTVVFDNSKDDL